jgi:hypothetical protein
MESQERLSILKKALIAKGIRATPPLADSVAGVAFLGLLQRDGKSFAITRTKAGIVRWLSAGFRFDDAEIVSVGVEGVTIRRYAPSGQILSPDLMPFEKRP